MEFFRQFNVSFRQTKYNKEEKEEENQESQENLNLCLFCDKGFKVDIFKAQKF